MISHKHKCIFVHIPKAGGTSIENVIWPLKKDKIESNLYKGLVDKYHNKYQTGQLQHLLASQIQMGVGKSIFRDYFKFTIVRNPWDKVISQFTYMQRREDLREFIGMKKDDGLKTYLSLIKKRKHVQWEHQHKFFLNEDGDQLVDYIARFENFNNCVESILKILKLDRVMFGLKARKIPHSKKGTREHYKYYFDNESSEIVHEMYNRDIELLGYKF